MWGPYIGDTIAVPQTHFQSIGDVHKKHSPNQRPMVCRQLLTIFPSILSLSLDPQTRSGKTYNPLTGTNRHAVNAISTENINISNIEGKEIRHFDMSSYGDRHVQMYIYEYIILGRVGEAEKEGKVRVYYRSINSLNL